MGSITWFQFQRIATLYLSIFAAFLGQVPKANSQRGVTCEHHFNRLTPRHFLDLNKMMGTWFLHEFASSDHGFDSVTPPFKCTRVEYIGSPNELANGKLKAVESYVNSTTGKMETFTMPIKIPNTHNVANAIWDGTTRNGHTKMAVLGTDLDQSNWGLFYSCSITNGVRWEFAGIYSRNPVLRKYERDMLKAFLVGLGFPERSHKVHSQYDC